MAVMFCIKLVMKDTTHSNIQEQISAENRLCHSKSLAVDSSSWLSLGTSQSNTENNSV